ncbi:molybdenum cofactor biosynthesis protein MoaE [Planifilum fimeticola]
MPDMMEIEVLFFAGIAEATGKRRTALAVEEGITVGDLIDLLCERYPDAAPLIRRSVVSLNQEYASADQSVRPEDEIALIPPVSGGEEAGEEDLFVVTEKPLSADRLIRLVSNPRAGAVLTFVGTVREWTQGKQTLYLEYEAYKPMAEKKMKEIADEISKRWPDVRVAMAHRVGRLKIGEISVIIAAAAPHRGDAFTAGRYAIERLKEIVPIWKKEVWADGSEWKGPQKGPWDPRVEPSS